MKTIATHIPVLANAGKYLPHFNVQWGKAGHYVTGALQQAFRDNVLSEAEMEFLLLTLTGFIVAAKHTIGNYIAHAKSAIK